VTGAAKKAVAAPVAAPVPVLPQDAGAAAGDAPVEEKTPATADKNKIWKNLLVMTSDRVIDILEDTHVEAAHSVPAVLHKDVGDIYVGVSRILCRAVVERCTDCMKVARKKPGSKPSIRALMTADHGARKVNFHVQLDLVDMQSTPGGPNKEYRYIFHYIDHFAKFSILRPITHKTMENVAHHLRDIWSLFGPPTTLQTDNGSEFKNHVVEHLCAEFNVDHVYSSPYNPSANGCVERANGTFCTWLTKWATSQPVGADWTVGLLRVQIEMNRRVRKTIGTTPYELVFNRPYGADRAVERPDRTALQLFDSDTEDGHEAVAAEVSASAAAGDVAGNSVEYTARINAARETFDHQSSLYVDQHNRAATTVVYNVDDIALLKMRTKKSFSVIDAKNVPVIILSVNRRNGTCRVGTAHGVLDKPVAFGDFVRKVGPEARPDGLKGISAATINAEWMDAKDKGTLASFVISSTELLSRVTHATQAPTELTSKQRMALQRKKRGTALGLKRKPVASVSAVHAAAAHAAAAAPAAPALQRASKTRKTQHAPAALVL
jgi:transposase InsO family protein